MSRTDPQFLLRMPAKLKKRLAKEAKAEGRTLTAHIVHILTLHNPKP